MCISESQTQPYFFNIYNHLRPFVLSNYLAEEERAGCVHKNAFLLLCVCLSHKSRTKRLVLFFIYIYNHLRPFVLSNYLAEKERAGCVNIIVFLLFCVYLSHKTGTKRLVLFCLYLITCIYSKLAILSLRKRDWLRL